MSSSTTHPLIAFYDPTNPCLDHRGRYLKQILSWPASRLESEHDYIQTLFPLPEASSIGWESPTITRQVFDAFRERAELRENLKKALVKMCWFYGFEMVEDDDIVVIRPGANYTQHCSNYDVKFDHNHLRITRIIRSLRCLSLPNHAFAFYKALSSPPPSSSSSSPICLKVSDRSLNYWQRAAFRPLNLRPDLEGVDGKEWDEIRGVGVRFLREYEEERRAIRTDFVFGAAGKKDGAKKDGGKEAGGKAKEEKEEEEEWQGCED